MHTAPQAVIMHAIQYFGPTRRPMAVEKGCSVMKVTDRIETESAMSSCVMLASCTMSNPVSYREFTIRGKQDIWSRSSTPTRCSNISDVRLVDSAKYEINGEHQHDDEIELQVDALVESLCFFRLRFVPIDAVIVVGTKLLDCVGTALLRLSAAGGKHGDVELLC